MSGGDKRTGGPVACVVLAGGAGRRFGKETKQLARLAGRPLLEYALATASASPVDRTVVVLGADAERILAEVEFGGVEPILCAGWEEGMAATLRAGIGALGEAAAAIVLLGDQPLMTPAAVELVLAKWRRGEPAVRATYDGLPGHPVALDRSLFSEVTDLRGDAGARKLLGGAARVDCGAVASPLDVDSPEDLRLAEHALTA